MNDYRLIRVSKDLSAAFEVIGTVAFSPQGPPYAAQLAIQGDNVYWLDYATSSQLLSCPKSGCGSTPNVLTTALNVNLPFAATIAVDDTSV